MSTSALRQITLGVEDLEDRTCFYCQHLGLQELRRGRVRDDTARALWGREEGTEGRLLGRPDVVGSMTLLLLGAGGPPARLDGGLTGCGPLGVGYTTRDIHAVKERFQGAGIRFLSPPVELTPEAQGPTGPRRYEAFGQAPDGDFLVLIERLRPPTPYGVISKELGVSEPLHGSHVVRDLKGCSRFMAAALEHESLFRETCAGERFERLMSLPAGCRFTFEMLHRPGFPGGRVIFIEFADGGAADLLPLAPPTRGFCSQRYDCSDLETTLERAAAAGGALRSGPVSIDDPVLGKGRVATLIPPHGTLVELWQDDGEVV